MTLFYDVEQLAASLDAPGLLALQGRLTARGEFSYKSFHEIADDGQSAYLSATGKSADHFNIGTARAPERCADFDVSRAYTVLYNNQGGAPSLAKTD